MSARGNGNLNCGKTAAFFLAILMVLTMLSPLNAGAEQTETHTHEGWTAVETLPTASGQYYLAKDIEISSAWTIGSGVEISLCLNDHSITMTAASTNAAIFLTLFMIVSPFHESVP